MFQKIKTWWASECRTVIYIKNRLREKSTLLGIVAAVGGGAGFEKPFSYIAVLAGIAAVFAPTSKAEK